MCWMPTRVERAVSREVNSNNNGKNQSSSKNDIINATTTNNTYTKNPINNANTCNVTDAKTITIYSTNATANNKNKLKKIN